MTDYYANWKARLAGAAVKTFLQPQLEDAGYYRKPIVKRLPNGQNETIGWEPVALWVENGEEGPELFGLIGRGDTMRSLSDNEIAGEELWSWISRNPIAYEIYKAVAEDGADWPDSKETQLANTMGETVPAANREVARNHNATPEEETDNRPEHEKVAESIDKAIAVSKAHEVKDQKSAEIALGIVNRLAELRLAAKRRGEELYKPHYNTYVTIRDQWKPPVERADTEEKRQTKSINDWKRAEEKRLREAAEKAETERKRLEAEAAARAAEEEERAQRAADRAIANGEPPSAAELPAIQHPDGPITLTEALRQPIATTVALAPTYGKRKLREAKAEPTYTVTSYDEIYEFFKKTEAVQNLLLLLAKNASKAGVAVPGITVTQPED